MITHNYSWQDSINSLLTDYFHLSQIVSVAPKNSLEQEACRHPSYCKSTCMQVLPTNAQWVGTRWYIHHSIKLIFERYFLIVQCQNLHFWDGDCLGLGTRNTVIKLAMTNCSRNISGILLSTTYLQEFFPFSKIRQQTTS